jgi:hypothetical protein
MSNHLDKCQVPTEEQMDSWASSMVFADEDWPEPGLLEQIHRSGFIYVITKHIKRLFKTGK